MNNHKETLALINDDERSAVALLSKDYNVWKRSTSGGAFTEICKVYDDGNTVFVGAAWDGWRVHHVCVESIQCLPVICKSKYIESKMEDNFIKIKTYLLSGKKVVFSGTPCQVLGLRKFLGIDYDNLLCIDLICHGVGSQSVFMKSIEVMNNEFQGNVFSYEFRSKRNVWEQNYLTKVKILFKKKSRILYLGNDRYMQLYLSQNVLRKTCVTNCRFRTENRMGDITIADFKGLHQVFPQLLGNKKNFSAVIFNNSKAAEIKNKLKKTCVIYECSLDNIKKYNPLFYNNTNLSSKRESFFEEFLADPQNAIKAWTVMPKPISKSLFRLIYNSLPIPTRKVIQRLKRRLHNEQNG